MLLLKKVVIPRGLLVFVLVFLVEFFVFVDFVVIVLAVFGAELAELLGG